MHWKDLMQAEITEAHTWQPGQLVDIHLPDRGVVGEFLIQRVTASPTWSNPSIWTYQVQYGGRLFGIADFLKALVSSQQKKRNIEPSKSIQKYVYGEETLELKDELATIPRSLPFVVEESIHERALVAKHEATINLFPIAKQTFDTGWSVYSGAVVTIDQNQVVEEWYTDTATRIRINGGSNTLNFYTNAVSPSVSGRDYAYGVRVKNVGVNPMRVQVGFNLADPNGVTVNPGETVWVKVENITGNGTNPIQIQFRTLSGQVGDALDFYAFEPQVEEKAYCTPYVAGVREEDEYKAAPIRSIGSRLRVYPIGWEAWPDVEIYDQAEDEWYPVDLLRAMPAPEIIVLRADKECWLDIYNYKKAFVESDAVCGMVVVSDG